MKKSTANNEITATVVLIKIPWNPVGQLLSYVVRDTWKIITSDDPHGISIHKMESFLTTRTKCPESSNTSATSSGIFRKSDFISSNLFLDTRISIDIFT